MEEYTKPTRYEKYGIIYVNGKKYSLIEFLQEKRTERKITKKFISNVIKKNDYWYSQIEMGKKDDSRRKYINRPDLISIISVIIFNASTQLDLERLHANSENYIDNIMKVTAYDHTPRNIPLHEAIRETEKLFNPEYTNERLNDTLKDFNTIITNFYTECNPIEKNSVIQFINSLMLNLSYEPLLTLHYCSLPFCTFFQAKPKNERYKQNIDETVLNEMDFLLKKYSELLCENDISLILTKLAQHIIYTQNYLHNMFSELSPEIKT